MFRVDANKKLDPNEANNPYGIKGFESTIQLIKSRTGAAGKSQSAVFDQLKGIDPIFSNFVYLKDNGIIEGSGYYALKEMPEVKFRLKQLKDVYSSNEAFKNAFDKAVSDTILANAYQII